MCTSSPEYTIFDVEHDHVDDVTGDRLSGCSSVWSSPTLDTSTGTLFVATGNCPHDIPVGSDWGRHVEAVSAIDADPRTWADPAQAVRWTFTPSPGNRDDTDFGATPNLFLDGDGRLLLGVGKKDAVYYALDPATGEPVWSTQVAEPGNIGEDFAVGGFIGAAATGRGGVFGATAIGGPPYFHALDGATGAVRWTGVAAPSYAAAAHVNGVVVAGALDALLKVWDARTGALLAAHPLAGPISSGTVIAGDRVYVGSGTASSDLCAKDAPGSALCLTVFDEGLGRTGGVHAFALAAPGHRAAVPGTTAGGLLLAGEGGRLWAHDLSTLERRVVFRAADGTVCADPSRPGHHLVGGVDVRLTGSALDDLAAEPVAAIGVEPAGCGFLDDGRLVTTAAVGEVRLWFPPFDRSCVLGSVPGAGAVLVHRGRVHVAARGGVFRYTGGLPVEVAGCSAPPSAWHRVVASAVPPSAMTAHGARVYVAWAAAAVSRSTTPADGSAATSSGRSGCRR